MITILKCGISKNYILKMNFPMMKTHSDILSMFIKESINKTFREYLVNFEFFTRVLENYGFVPITTQEANAMGFPQAIGSFEDLFDNMMDDIHNNKLKKFNIGKAANLSANEKIISFLNNYFIYKKVRNPNAKEITDNILNIPEQEPN